MGDSMPKPKNLSRECGHKWQNVVVTEQKTVVGEMEVVIDRKDVYFCDNCETVLDDV